MKQYWKMKEFGWVWCELYILWRTIIRSIPFHFIPWLEKEYGFESSTQKKRAVILLLYTFFTLSPKPTLVPTQLGSKSPKHEMLRFLDCTLFKSYFCFLHTLVMSETKPVHKENSLLQRGIFSSTDFAEYQKVRYAFVTIMTIRKLSSLRNLWRYAWKQSKENRFPHSRKFRLFPYSQSS